jgi:hypothetical protein
MLILTPIERETIQVFFFKEKPVHVVALVCRQETVVPNMAFSKREDLRNRITAAVARVDRDADTRVERDGLSHRCLPYYQRWIS